MNVAILGASHKPDRYSFKAFQMLREAGHKPLPVHPKISEIEGVAVSPSLGEIPDKPHTVTVYLSEANSERITDEILACPARRFIFNPGAENPDLERRLAEKGAEVLRACTLVMLRTGQF